MALWMNLGTINVVNGSKAVTGVGTKFKTAPIPAREGQPIVINNVHYEIGSVNSDTSITLALNYAGTTANSLPYTIITTAEGSFNDLSRRAAQVMSLYQGYMDVYHDLFTETGSIAVTLPDGTVVNLPTWNYTASQTVRKSGDTMSGSLVVQGGVVARALTTMGFYLLGTVGYPSLVPMTAEGDSLYNDSLRYLGTGDWRLGSTSKIYHQSNALGPVSQSGGTPTGAIIERGSNANGEYVKFADGTMMCDGLVSYPTTGPVDGFLVTYAATFASVRGINASVTAFLTSTSNTAVFVAEAQGVSTSQCRVKATRDIAGALSAPTTAVTIAFRAYGRWF